MGIFLIQITYLLFQFITNVRNCPLELSQGSYDCLSLTENWLIILSMSLAHALFTPIAQQHLRMPQSSFLEGSSAPVPFCTPSHQEVLYLVLALIRRIVSVYPRARAWADPRASWEDPLIHTAVSNITFLTLSSSHTAVPPDSGTVRKPLRHE